MLRRAVLALAPLLLLACAGDGGSGAAADAATDAAADDAPGAPGDDAAPADGAGEADADAGPGTPDAEPDADPGPPPPPGRAERGLVELRTIAHLHSVWSHDGCDEKLEAEGVFDWTCVHRMKSSLCQERIAVAFMTDHPSFMDEQPFGDLLYAEEDKGDIVLTDGDGAAWGVSFACPDEDGGADGRVILVPGFEGPHTMPLGLRRHLSDPALYGVKTMDSTPPEDLAALTAEIRAAGGRLAIAHSEESNLSWETIAAHDIPAMELYNFHANFNSVMQADLTEALGLMDAFLDPSPSAPPSDLAALAMLGVYPEPALTKWRRVSVARPITAFAGSDVHENVQLPAICEAIPCDGLKADFPNMTRFLEVGGKVIMSDGDRLDAYGRIFRWVQNRALVDADADPLTAVEDAFEHGRVVVVFEVMGDAPGVDLVAEDAVGELHEMGRTVAAGATLWARSPDVPVPARNAAWSDGAAAEMTATLWRTTADGSEAVRTWGTPGTWVSVPLDAAGAYSLEVTLTPRHLEAVLGPAAVLAERTYRWVLTNAIRVE